MLIAILSILLGALLGIGLCALGVSVTLRFIRGAELPHDAPRHQ